MSRCISVFPFVPNNERSIESRTVEECIVIIITHPPTYVPTSVLLPTAVKRPPSPHEMQCKSRVRKRKREEEMAPERMRGLCLFGLGLAPYLCSRSHLPSQTHVSSSNLFSFEANSGRRRLSKRRPRPGQARYRNLSSLPPLISLTFIISSKSTICFTTSHRHSAPFELPLTSRELFIPPTYCYLNTPLRHHTASPVCILEEDGSDRELFAFLP